MFDTVCTLPLPSNVFSQSLHPKESVLAAGLASGHVQVFRLPTSSDDEDGRDSKEGVGQVVTQWSTRRHKGSCRSLAFSLDGEVLFSGGNDGIVKAASASTGRVTAKIAVPSTREVAVDKSSVIYPLSAQTLLVATDSSALYLYDLRAGSAPFTEDQIPQQSHHPHDDYISSISPLPPSESSTSGSSKQWVTTGDTTLAVTDLRRGVLARSEDQEDELLSSVVVSGVRTSSSRPNGEKVAVGGAGGVLTLWERGVWRDQGERIVVDKAPGGGESLDAVTRLPEGVDHLPSTGVAVGMGNGLVRIVGLSPNKVIGELLHDEVESVVALGVDSCGRLFSAGGQTIKVWIPREIGPEEEKAKNGVLKSKKGAENHDRQSGSDEEDGQDDSDDEPETRARHKRRKKGKGGQVNKRKKLFGFHGLD